MANFFLVKLRVQLTPLRVQFARGGNYQGAISLPEFLVVITDQFQADISLV